MTNIVLISGPGGYAFNNANVQKLATAMRSAGAQVTLIGDGEHPISKESLKETLADISQKSSEPTTLFIMAHGDVKNGQHAIDIDGKFGLSSAELFDMANHSFGGRPVDVFMTSCHGGAAITEVNKLPKGSTLATLAPGKETVSGTDVDSLVDAIQAESFSARQLATLYLGKALKNRMAPNLAISGEGVRNLPREFEARIGKSFSNDEKHSAHTQLDAVIGAEKVDEMLGKISNAKSEWNILAVDFGPALAVMLASSDRTQALSSYDPNQISHSGGNDRLDWSARMMQGGDFAFRGGKRTAPKPRTGWTDNS